MELIKGVVKKIDSAIVEEKEIDEYLQQTKTLLKTKNTITMDDGNTLYADCDLDFKEGDYIGFVVSGDDENQVKYFINQNNAEKIKEKRKFKWMDKFNFSLQFFFIYMSISNISKDLNMGISYLLLLMSVILIGLNCYIFLNNRKERKNIDDYLESIPPTNKKDDSKEEIKSEVSLLKTL